MPDPDGSMFAWPQVPTLDCCLRLLLSMFHCTHSCASKYGMVHTLSGMPSRACVSISNKAKQCPNKARIKLPKKAQTKEGVCVDLRGLGPPWKKKVGFDALARGFACCLHITSKGEPPAYCLSLCRRSSGHGMLHISHMQRQRVLAQLRMYCWCSAPSQGLVEPAVRVYVYRHVDR